MNKQFVMLSGLPRSGSSVLTSMLNQHPDIYASTTSPIIDMIEIIHPNWQSISAGLISHHPDQYPNMIKGLCYGAYEHIDKSIIIDKNRIWPRYGKLMRDALGHKPKIICTVRNIPEILASYILLINKNSDKITFIDQDLIDNNLPINNKNRCKLLWEKYMNLPYLSLKVGLQSSDIDLCVVDYNEITSDGQLVIDKICKFIGVDTFALNTTNLQKMDENDNFHGGIDGLHHVRPVLERTSPDAEQVIGHHLVKLYNDMKLDIWNR